MVLQVEDMDTMQPGQRIPEEELTPFDQSPELMILQTSTSMTQTIQI